MKDPSVFFKACWVSYLALVHTWGIILNEVSYVIPRILVLMNHSTISSMVVCHQPFNNIIQQYHQYLDMYPYINYTYLLLNLFNPPALTRMNHGDKSHHPNVQEASPDAVVSSHSVVDTVIHLRSVPGIPGVLLSGCATWTISDKTRL